MTNLLPRSSVGLYPVVLFSLFFVFTAFQDIEACSEPPPIPPGVEVTALDDFGQLFEIRLDGYSTFGSPDGDHFCVCGLGFINTFGFEVIDVISARLVLAGTDDLFMTFDFDYNNNTTGDLPGNDFGADIWIGMFATINGVIPAGVAVDLVFEIAVDQFGQVRNKRKLSRSELQASEEEILGALAFVATDEGNPDGTLSGNHPGIFDLRGLLPVELTSFEASIDGQNVVLDWSTSQETNNAGFEIIHNLDGVFDTLGFVEGAGSVTETNSYQFEVKNLVPGRHRFRLKQIDFSGSYTYSEYLDIEIDVPGNFLVIAPYPNPFTSQTTVQFSVKESQGVVVSLFDMLGKVQQSISREVQGGRTEKISFESLSMPAGIYFLQVKGENFERSMPVTLIR